MNTPEEIAEEAFNEGCKIAINTISNLKGMAEEMKAEMSVNVHEHILNLIQGLEHDLGLVTEKTAEAKTLKPLDKQEGT